MQTNIFGEIETFGLTIEQAAKVASVSTATIRNWIKTGYLIQSGKGLISDESIRKFMLNVAGKEKLNYRANKLLKDEDNHIAISNNIHTIFSKYTGEGIGKGYEESLSNSYRNREGIYYTPTWIVRDMLSKIKIKSNYTFLDPCCGSGNFIIEAIKMGVAPENVYGFDLDENAVVISKQRIKQEFGIETNNILHGDFLHEAYNLNNRKIFFDLIFTNPPWGKKIDKEEKEKYSALYKCGNSLDTSSFFMAASLSILKQGGFLGFLLQEAFFNIATFADMRKRVATSSILSFVDYEKPFKGLMTKAQAIIIENKESKLKDKIECSVKKRMFQRSRESFERNPKHIFNFWTDESEACVINRLYNIKHITLKHKAKWALGIVTGNNDRYCWRTPKEGYVPIYKGSDITKEGIKKPSTFILNDFSKFQQVAPMDMYEAKEKLIYKFISSDLCFYYDTEQRYVLNSANILIPLNVGIPGDSLAKLLNSEIMNWLFKKLFSTHKVLRGDLESLPLHVDYFSEHQEFSEISYLDYLNIEKTKNGTFRIKEEDY
ncbi:MAG: hypothetical protein AMXMBFR51_30400 [Ignavibacteriota bacterium]